MEMVTFVVGLSFLIRSVLMTGDLLNYSRSFRKCSESQGAQYDKEAGKHMQCKASDTDSSAASCTVVTSPNLLRLVVTGSSAPHCRLRRVLLLFRRHLTEAEMRQGSEWISDMFHSPPSCLLG